MIMGKRYKAGMYGGKFFPFHEGHLMCILHAAVMCDRLHVILFINGEFERNVESSGTTKVTIIF